MKKSIIFIVGIWYWGFSDVYGQMVVTDLLNTELNRGISVMEESSNEVLHVINSVLGAMQKVSETKNNSEFVKNLKTVVKVKEALELLICQQGELKYEVARSVGIESCFVKMRYSITLMNVQLSNDLISIITLQSAMAGLDKKTLSSGELLEILNEVCDNIQKSAVQIRSFTSALRDAYDDYIRRQAEIIAIDSEKGLTYNRYR
jgi:hypothetical protein